MTPQEELAAAIAPLRWGALLLGLLAGGACAWGWYYSPQHFFPAYLVAYLFWLGTTLGSLAIVMLHHLTGGGWGLGIRRLQEAVLGTMPLLAALFLPLLTGLPVLYPWARADAMHADEILQKKAAYLNVPAFEVRVGTYFAIWILLALLLNWLSAGMSPEEARRRRRWLALISGPGLVLWGLTVTFAAIDWGMSLEPHWYSSIYGVLFMGGQGVSGLAFAILMGVLLRSYAPFRDVLSTDRLHDLGNLLLAFVLFWSYVSFTQYLIIWSGNLPEETPWYLQRSGGGWQFLAMGLIGLHFLVPFLLLLARGTKREPRRLAGVAVLLLLMRLVDLTWLVMPTFSPGRLSVHWLNFAAPLAIGGLWLAAFFWRLPARIALPLEELPSDQEFDHEQE